MTSRTLGAQSQMFDRKRRKSESNSIVKTHTSTGSLWRDPEIASSPVRPESPALIRTQSSRLGFLLKDLKTLFYYSDTEIREQLRLMIEKYDAEDATTATYQHQQQDSPLKSLASYAGSNATANSPVLKSSSYSQYVNRSRKSVGDANDNRLKAFMKRQATLNYTMKPSGTIGAFNPIEEPQLLDRDAFSSTERRQEKVVG